MSDEEPTSRRDTEATPRTRIAGSTPPFEAAYPEDARRLLHDLRVHQIELEMQNDELRRTHAELDRSLARYFHLYDLAPVGYCTVGTTGLILEANLAAATLLGLSRKQLVQQPVTRFILDVDQDRYYLLSKQVLDSGRASTSELRLRTSSGATCWVSLKATAASRAADVPHLLLVLTEITATKIAEEQQANEHHVLELVAKGGPLREILANLVLGYEALVAGMRGSVLLLDPDGLHLRHGAAPHLPPAYCQAIDGIEIGPNAGSCGTAVYTGKAVMVADIAEDALWQPFRDLALAHGLRSCWSVPICGTGGRVLGSFAFYHDHVATAQVADVAALERGAYLASLAIERQQAVDALRQSERDLQDAEEVAHLGHWTWDGARNQLSWSAEMQRIWQREPAEFGHDYAQLIAQAVHPADQAQVLEASGALFHEPHDRPLEARVRMADGSERTVSILAGKRVVDIDGKLLKISGIVQDITARKRAEAERDKLQARLEQAHKMESVGRLAGGVAHDFNNMLSVILGHSQLAMQEIDPQHPVHADLTEIHHAAVRSAALTRQLLAFARKQTVAPKVLDVNVTVAGMLTMLRRLIGENISITWHPAATPWPIQMDPSQLEQLLTNLCVNAREAIADVGTITIETTNCVIDATYCATHIEASLGEYVRLTVSDTGCGMDAATLSQIFEPFFTTKSLGEGTGLGLATAYGVVTQNRGFLEVFSEPNQGTRFEIYLPRHQEAEPEARDAAIAPAHPSATTTGTETGPSATTILVVEDEPVILKFTMKRLEAQGYRVLSAPTPTVALRIAEAHVGEIHLLLTDVIMPEMNGQALASLMVSRYPHIQCLYMSGYPANVIAKHGVLNSALHFIEKPFAIEDLTSAVRTALATKFEK
jgi:PAS domain S-box-containing protein